MPPAKSSVCPGDPPRRKRRAGDDIPATQTSGGNDAAEAYLKTLPEDVVMKLLSLMTMGKDKNPNIHKIYDDLKGLTRDKTEAIRGMTSRVPLADYLEKVLKIADERRIDLEVDF